MAPKESLVRLFAAWCASCICVTSLGCENCSSKGEPPPPCERSARCTENGWSCCNEGSGLIFECRLGLLELLRACTGKFEHCEDGNPKCACEIGTQVCDATGVLLGCVAEQSDAGQATTSFRSFPCDSTCGDDPIKCPACACKTPCQSEQWFCSADLQRVLRCVDKDGQKEFEVVRDCAVDRMICEASTATFGAVDTYCVNLCGGHKRLSYDPCDRVVKNDFAPAQCGVYVCDGSDAIKSVRKACSPGGWNCQTHQECNSCNCQNGKCMGSGPNLCPEEAAAGCTLP